MNLLLYSWNDLDDSRIDKLNSRKGYQYLLGVGGDVAQDRIWHCFLLGLNLNFFFLLYFIHATRQFVRLTAWFAASCALNFLYNTFPRLREGPAPFDLVGPLGYVLVIPFSSIINGVDLPASSTLLFHVVMVLRSQIWGEIIDLSSDWKGGRRTTAMAFDKPMQTTNIRGFQIFIIFFELILAVYAVDNIYVALFSGISLVQAVFDLVALPPKPPSLKEAAIAGATMTPAAALLLMEVRKGKVF